MNGWALDAMPPELARHCQVGRKRVEADLPLPRAQGHFLCSTLSASAGTVRPDFVPHAAAWRADTYWFQPVASRGHFTAPTRKQPLWSCLCLRSKGEPFKCVKQTRWKVKSGHGRAIDVYWKQFSGGSLVYKPKKALKGLSCPRVISCDGGSSGCSPLTEERVPVPI